MVGFKESAILSTFLLSSSHVAQAARSSLDRDSLAKQYFGNDVAWYRERIPFFESSDRNITDVYYYRWQIFRAHQRDLGPQGYITTEFIDDVGWQFFPSAWLDDATQFHFNEARWCRDRRFRVDHARFIYEGADFDVRHFSENMAASVWGAYLVDGVHEDIVKLLDGMRRVYEAWDDHFDESKGLYYIEPLLDATEYTIASIDASCGVDGFGGGVSFRPTINAYQYGNARAIANIADLAGLSDIASDYNARADAIKQNFRASMWNSSFEHFIDRHYESTQCAQYWDFIRGRELAGYVPWLHDLPDDLAIYAQSWKHLLDSDKLAGPFGLRTVEPSYEYYMKQYRYDAETGRRECQWNGPVWPYQTSQVLAALANVLDHYPKTAAEGIVSASNFVDLLSQYANMHYNKNHGGYLNLEEDYDPATGQPIVGLDRSSHYFHSSFIDLVISGLVGIRPSADDVLEINPLATKEKMDYFRLEGVIYHGNEVSVQWDVDGSRYGADSGFSVEVNGEVAARSENLQRLSVSVLRKTPPLPRAPVAKSIQLQPTSETSIYPVGSVSVDNADANKVQDAIDGRVWFFPQPTDTYTISHGWQTPIGSVFESESESESVWYMIDFGTNTVVRSCELAFFSGDGVDVPASYRVEILTGENSWRAVDGPTYPDIMANGVTWASWDEVTTSKIRLVFAPPAGKAVRLVEWKVFSELVDGTVFV